ncbi:zinc-dependent alcohol dehydrogenase family protein [Rhizorhabdus dicambivorans]|uniref:alcohol dehydrogenase n=1 Tax=Rhizorhabdus dicambivorans TaxID=1850238 RepID=A0A2A4FRW8_9SPHN|nr:zinc-dependent alcohol dehydrogenase family protein [Rhizorhabdus dicambivorans]ATE63882.1 zinc-binding alcohol dehydrogenase family protein [Rhizorhabdus dicambivorans]PCE41485.1 zinc-binding alcohol dehydrogenase family protein [Rhizorhabdus dicambivorans]
MQQRHVIRLFGPGEALEARDEALPDPGPHQLLIAVSACGVCRTDLHVCDGDIPARYPIIPGHEIVGRVVATGAAVTEFRPGDRVGVPWLGGTCGHCAFCRDGRENLCDAPVFTGCTIDGGYASHSLADARYCLAIPPGIDDVAAAPLLCAGLIGWRALRLAGEGHRIGLYGFGAAAHIIAQVAIAQGREVYGFTRPGDGRGQEFARSLGCRWAGGSDEAPPVPLDAALIFAPVGALVPRALKAVTKGGRVVCAGIHMTDIPAFPYADLWGERSILSVANLTRDDGRTFFTAIEGMPVKSVTHVFPLAEAGIAMSAVREGMVDGAVVLVP